MKKIFALLVLLITISLSIKNVSKSDNYNVVALSNIEALAWGETGEDVYYRCYVGDIAYVMAEARRYCGNCSYDYVNPVGDGFCKTGNIFESKV